VPSLNKLEIKDFKFGIELESNINLYSMRDKLKFQTGWRCHEEHCGSEIVSPILVGWSGLLDVRRQIRSIWSVWNEIKFSDCGLHVHIDIQDFNLGQAKKLILIASRFDQTIFCMMDGTRWINTYAQRCSYKEKTIKTISGLKGLQGIQRHSQRYAGLNMHAFSKHGTVEFRYAMGSADWRKIYSLISMYLRMVAVAKSETPVPKVIKIEGVSGRHALPIIEANYKSLEKNKDTFFDFLQIKGGTRDVLSKMFMTNATDIKGRNGRTASQLTEQKQTIKFSLKDK